MGHAVDGKPLARVGLVLADLVADLRMEDLGPAAREAPEASVFELDEDVAERALREVLKPVDLHWRPGLEVERRIVVVEETDDVEIPVVVFLVVEPADDVHLGAAGVNRFFAAGEDLLRLHHIAAGIAEIGPEGAERAAVNADIRGVEMGVDVVIAGVAVFPLADEIRKFTELVEIDPLVPQHLRLGSVEALPGLDLLAHPIEGRNGGTDHGGFSDEADAAGKAESRQCPANRIRPGSATPTLPRVISDLKSRVRGPSTPLRRAGLGSRETAGVK